MWCVWGLFLVVSGALAAEQTGAGAMGAEGATATTTRSPPRTLDRRADELVWKSWLQGPENGNQNAPPRRITTKSLFITPLVCPKGQRLDRNGCVQVVSVNKDEHERILLEQLNALFTSAPSQDVIYDYGDEEPGPLQLSIPIGLEPQTAPLQAVEPSAQAHETQHNLVKFDKKDQDKPTDISMEAELELLKLQHTLNAHNNSDAPDGTNILNHNVLNNFLPFPDKPKRDSPVQNDTDKITYEGQKEIVFGHVNVDPVLYDAAYSDQAVTILPTTINIETMKEEDQNIDTNNNNLTVNNNVTDTANLTHTNTTNTQDKHNIQKINDTQIYNLTIPDLIKLNTTSKELTKGNETKLNPENDYSDIGEAIKLISRYAEVTTDDNFSKDKKKYPTKDDGVLGTRTKLQYRRNKPKPEELNKEPLVQIPVQSVYKDRIPIYHKPDLYYRYPWPSQYMKTPPPDYPFRHLQDYWPGRVQVGGVYTTFHENPRRHHHSYPHNAMRFRSYPYSGFPGNYAGSQEGYAGRPQFTYNPGQFRASQQSPTTNQDLYTLLGLRHWFSSESTSKR